MISYPARPQYFAHRFIRLMTKSALAMEVGSEGTWLLSVIAMQEDSCRYSKAVSFWNSQLTVLLGFRNDHEARMRRIRQRCVDAGWLNYEPGGRTHPGHYFVTIPTHLIQIEDGPCDESGFESDNETTLKRQQSDNETTLKRQQSDSFLTSPVPSPSPLPVESARDEHDIAAPADSTPPAADPDRWIYVRAALWAKSLVKAGCKIGPQNWPAWKALIDKHGLDRVVSVAKTIPADVRWSDRTEMALEKSGGQAPIAQAIQHRIRTIKT